MISVDCTHLQLLATYVKENSSNRHLTLVFGSAVLLIEQKKTRNLFDLSWIKKYGVHARKKLFPKCF